MSKIHPKEETYLLQRRFSAAKVRKKNDIRKSVHHFSVFFFSVIGRWMLNHPFAKSNLWMELYCFPSSQSAAFTTRIFLPSRSIIPVSPYITISVKWSQ